MTSNGFLLILSGAGTTIEIAIQSIFFSLLIAIVVGTAMAMGGRVLRYTLKIYVELFRGTALIVQLFWMYFVLPQFGILLSEKVVAISAISLNYGAYGAVVVAGAINAIDKSQWEAAASLGLRRLPILRLVVLPQASVLLIKPLGVLYVQLVKATSLVSLITIADLTYRAYQLNQLSMHIVPIFGTVMLIYYAMTKCVAATAGILDHYVGTWRLASGARS
ncbi:amino acid ABC transporter permease [Labrys okinawensis]|uniref:amino acid ABC transporter permease n=1 Tax=Labrys okinawensis TaxID=346911 RepID=UPI0039BC63A5